MTSSKAFSRYSGEASNQISLKSVRDALIRLEDSIVFGLIERARHPYNAPAYDQSYLKSSDCSLAEFFVKEAEYLHAKAGRYQNPEEIPFFPEDLPSSLLPLYNYPHVLHPAAASLNITKTIWNMYFNELLPLFISKGDDGNYASTLASDLVCLQALSRRIHYGKFVAEVKFRDSPLDYSPAIHNKDKDALMRMLTFESVEEMVKRRVEKKALVFGQPVTMDEDKDDKVNCKIISSCGSNDCSDKDALMRMLTFESVEEMVKWRVEKKALVFGQPVTMDEDKDDKVNCKVDPSVVSRIYGDWIIPLTKLVEVDYLLLRLE